MAQDPGSDVLKALIRMKSKFLSSLMGRGRRPAACFVAAGLLCSGLALAQSGPPGGDGGRPPGPPPEAVAACSGKAAGAGCSFTGRQGESLSGQCETPPGGASSSSGTVLACRPANMPPPPGNR